jgi:nicotinamidase-related amidase
LWNKKAPSLQVLRLGSALAALDPRLPAGPQDTLIIKKYASAFFGTSLAATLTAAGVDTVLVAGTTTSGCVRASVVDALQYGFRPIVLSDAVADRAEGPHQANLFDMGSKYADLASTEDVLAYLRELPPDVDEEAGRHAGHGPR